MNRRLLLVGFSLILGFVPLRAEKTPQLKSQAEQIRLELENASSQKILVVAHRAAWKNAPENSRRAVLDAIELGVDIIEIDVRKTKDGKFVLMHDTRVDRTTNGKGKVKDLTLEDLRKLHLKGPDGKLTEEKIPTLSEILEMSKGKILINLDKAKWPFREILSVLEKTGTSRQVILKGRQSPKKVSVLLEANPEIIYMSKFNFKGKDALSPQELDEPLNIHEIYPIDKRVPLVEIKFASLDCPAVSRSALRALKQMNVRAWINTLKVSHSANYTDRRAMKTPEKVWGRLIERGFSVFQTDEPKALLEYLKTKGRHN